MLVAPRDGGFGTAAQGFPCGLRMGRLSMAGIEGVWMERKPIVTAVVTVTVFAWGAVMAVMGQEAAIITTAPVLALTVQQVVRAVRARTAPASGHRVAAVPDKEEDSAP
ncbi:hypothetical protein OG250_42590 [Streptomyces sp. NBC_00487]|uniref:hypothetical protein n=1 Tax=unclassified Streptomyces TaxID=2593676 RepID=UPI002E18BBFF|nr:MULTISPECIES: hypothetical protein [unclassified Streptomyces]